jgi:C4-dicarboxylate transporter, DctM subunit
MKNSKQSKADSLIRITSVTILALMIVIPLMEAFGRRFLGIGIPGSADWVQHMTLWIGLLGAIIATTRNSHLSVSITQLFKSEKISRSFENFNQLGSILVLIILAWAGTELVTYEYENVQRIAGWLPVWVAQLAIPLSFAIMAILLLLKIYNDNKETLKQLVLPLSLIILSGIMLWLGLDIIVIIILILFLLSGMPIFIVLAAVSLVLFSTVDIPLVAVPSETYQMVTQPVLPGIPLFALAGTVLAAGGAPQRYLRLLKAWLAWLPGGLVIAAVAGCAFFTAITGASGVTILALGGIMLPVLIAGKYSEKFSSGLLTASGSIGLMFPPSLPVILYGVYSHVAIDQLFLAALIPGILLLIMIIFITPFFGEKSDHRIREKFNLKEAGKATLASLGDLLLPLVIIAGFFGGLMTIIETAALTALWAIVLELLIYKKIDLKQKLPDTMVDSTVMIGSLLIVLGMALGLVSFLVDTQIPQKAASWISSVIESKYVFLLILNVLLLLVGALMDIFSAIVIVVPLMVPVALSFGIDPVHLGIVFLANLELGYLTPPVGMNLFLSSLRFKKPLYEIWKTVWPFLVVFIVWVLIITYIPFISIGILGR